jgi:peptidoglycan/xylan/chitin deacetylase (PgdA/CDA1 family)
VHWDVVSEDGFNDDTQGIEHNILDHVQNGSIIVMHFNGPPNEPSDVAALEVVIPELKKRGFEFVKVSELLHPQQAGAINIKSYLLSFETRS